MGQPLKPAPPGYRWIYTPHFRHRQSGKLIRTNDHGKARLPVPCAGRPPLIKGGASRLRGWRGTDAKAGTSTRIKHD